MSVRVTPRAGVDAVDGLDEDGTLRVRLRAAPADGAANAALIKLIAAELGVPPSSISISRGASGRHKLVALKGGDADALQARWPGLDVRA